MKLKTKRLLAVALALSLTANISMAAFAVTYDLSEGSVTITDDDDESHENYTGIWSYQGEDETQGSTDTTIIIVQGSAAKDAVDEIDADEYDSAEDIADAVSEALANVDEPTESTSHDITIKGDVSDADIIIYDVDIKVEDKNSAAITIESGAEVDDLVIQDSDITVDGQNSSGILIEDSATAEIDMNDSTITADILKSNCIQVGTGKDLESTTLVIDGNDTSTLNGKITINGNDCVIENLNFVGDGCLNEDGTDRYPANSGYYSNNNAIKVNSVNNLTIKGNTFTGYTAVTEFGDYNVTNEVFTENTVNDCKFLFHTVTGGVTGLTITNNILEDCTSCMANTTLDDFSGNKLINASFGLQNCEETDMAQFITKNSYDHGFIYQETVDYYDGHDDWQNGESHSSSTTVMTILPTGVSAVWKSLDDGQQIAIDNGTAENSTYSIYTWTSDGGYNPEDAAAIGYHYTDVYLEYEPIPDDDEPHEPIEPDEPEIPVVPTVPGTTETPAQPETPAETPADPETPAEESDTPASSTPKTGDDSNVAIYLVMAALSGAALIGLGVTGRKKNEEV